MRTLLAFAFLACSLFAQQVHVANRSDAPFSGWIRRTVDRWAPDTGASHVRGKWIAPGLWHVDVRADDMPAGSATTLDLSRAPRAVVHDYDLALKHWPSLGGTRMSLRSLEKNGAGVDGHWQVRLDRIVVCDVWMTFYAGQGWAPGKLQVSASNPTLPDKSARLKWNIHPWFRSGAEVRGAWSGWGKPLIRSGMTVGHGQGLPPVPFVALFDESERPSAEAYAKLEIGAIGVNKVWPTGNPLWHESRGHPRAFVEQHWQPVADSLQDWSTLTPLTFLTKSAYTSGGEPDQVFVGADLGLGQESAGGEWLRWMTAASMARRPGLWTEISGSRLHIRREKDLAMFEGYPFARGNSRDLFEFGSEMPHEGADLHGYRTWREHMFYNNLFVAYRATGCPALQWQIERRASLYLFEHTTDPEFTTTAYTGANRGLGWSALLAWHLWHSVEDRWLARQVRDRWIWRWENVLRARLQGEYWMTAYGKWYAWQQGPIAYFVDLAGEAFDVPEAREFALRAARKVVDDAYTFDGDASHWVPYPYVVLDPSGDPVLSASTPWGGTSGWMVTASATVLRHDPKHEKARALVDQDASNNRLGGLWIPPEVVGGTGK